MKLILFLAIGHRAAGDRGCPEKSLREVWVFFGVYLAAAWACLWQWGSPHPPSRIDLFSGGFFTLATLWFFENRTFLKSVSATKELRREELHMREQYGSLYEEYASKTRRLFPGVY